MQVLGKGLCGCDDDGREQGPEEEALQRDGDGGDDELRDEPEEELEAHCGGEVDLVGGCMSATGHGGGGGWVCMGKHITYHDGQSLTEHRRDEAEDDSPYRYAHPEAHRG